MTKVSLYRPKSAATAAEIRFAGPPMKKPQTNMIMPLVTSTPGEPEEELLKNKTVSSSPLYTSSEPHAAKSIPTMIGVRDAK